MIFATPVLGQDDVSVGPPRVAFAPSTTTLVTAERPPMKTAPMPTAPMPTAPTTLTPTPAPAPPAPQPTTEAKSGCPWWCWVLIAVGGATVIGLAYYATRK